MTSTTEAKPSRIKRRTVAAWLAVGQLIAVHAALFAAVIEIETILVTGPVLSLLGLALAVVSRPWGSWRALVMGLSAPAVCAIGAAMIAVFHLVPAEADGPVVALLAFYWLGIVPLGVIVLLEMRGWPAEQPPRLPRVWHFSLKSLFGLMTLVALLTAFLTSVASAFTDFPLPFALFACAVISAAAVIAWRFVLQIRRPAPIDRARGEAPTAPSAE